MNEAIQRFLIVSADAALIAAVEAAVGDVAVLVAAPGLAEARSLVGSAPLTGIIVDASALRGSVAPQLAALRAAQPLVNILFVASELRGPLLNDIQPLRIELLARPLPASSIDRFVQRTLSAGRLSDREVAAYIERLASEHKLSGNDIALFPLVLERETPEALCARLNIDREALARGLRRLVKKCRVRNTDRLAKNLMRDALLFASAPSARSYTLAYAAA
jgi:hypothetical protein